MLLLADHSEEPGNDDNTECRGKIYSGPGSLMTSLESLDQALPEAKGVSASHSQYPLIKSHWTPIILASVVCPALISHHQGKLPGIGYSPLLKVLQLEKKPKSYSWTGEQQFTKRKERRMECWINSTTATISHYTYKGPSMGQCI